MVLTIDNLKNCFQAAELENAKYIGVKIEMIGFEKPEIIINENINFKKKMEYYLNAYNTDLTLKTFNGIKIIGFTYGNKFNEIENDLLGDCNDNI